MRAASLFRSPFVSAFALGITLLAVSCQTPPSTETAGSSPATLPIDPTIARIRDEGLNHSQVMETLDHLCNVIGPRLTGSPELKRANEWTRDQMASWGLANAHLEPWGPFGRGWTLKRFAIQVVEPEYVALKGYPKAWSPGFDKPFEASVIYLDATDEAGLARYQGTLKGQIVLIGPIRDITPHFEPLATRFDDKSLATATTYPAGTAIPAGEILARPPSGRGRGPGQPATGPATQVARGRAGAPATAPAGRGGRGGGPGGLAPARLLAFATQEGAALVVDSSATGDGGVIVVQSASVPSPAGGGRGRGPSAWSSSDPPPALPPQVTLAIEDFDRLAHMCRQGQKLRMAVDLQVQYQTSDDMAYNTIAEIPGTDLRDQIVMLGGHLDSWAAGTGATDNGAGAAAAMEAVRILKALNLQPRRTIRVALWSGEEQGLLGSAAYVRAHFGSRPGGGRGGFAGRGGRAGFAGRGPASTTASQPASRPALVKGPEYDALSVYFNLDNGAGKIRGIYLQSDEGAVPYFQRWLQPLADLGAGTITLGNVGQTDHASFDNIGLPGFQFIQDSLDYFPRTHHTNADVYERILPDDIKQAATVLAVVVWDAANANERLPRRPNP